MVASPLFCSIPDDASREAAAAVHVGLWVSATRCVLTYVVAPVAGAVGVFLGPTRPAAPAGRRDHRDRRSPPAVDCCSHRLRLPYVALAFSVDLLAVIALLELLDLTLGQVLR